MDWLSYSGLIIALNLIGAVILTLYKLGELHLLYYYLTRRRRPRHGHTPAPLAGVALPRVTVQIPMYNELYVAERVIDACVALDWPRHLLEIQVLDDSTDESLEISRARVAHWRAQGVDISLHHRTNRAGYKAGALAEATPKATGEFIAVFDADFVPPPGFLRHAVAWFADDQVGVVQGRWGHLNEQYSMLTRVQSVFLDMHFMVEQPARYVAGFFTRFNGSGGVWRARCIAEAGGWSAETLAEDLDLVFRAQLDGWKAVYDPTLVAPAEIPVTMSDFKAQQYRWSKGKAQVVKKLTGRIARARLPFLVKAHALFDLLNLTAYPGVLMISLGSVPILWVITTHPEYTRYLAYASVAFVINTLVGPWYVLIVLRQRLHSWRAALREFVAVFPPLIAIAMGITVFQVTALADGFFGKQSPFVKTGKYRITKASDRWRGKLYSPTQISPTTYVEGTFVLLFATAIVAGFYLDNLSILPFHLILMTGYGYVFGRSVVRA